MQRRKFSREFKLEAVRLVRERGVSVAQASRDLDVPQNVLRNDHSRIKLWQIRPKEDSFKLRRSLVNQREIEAIGVRESPFLMFKDIVWPDTDEMVEVNEDSFDDVGANG